MKLYGSRERKEICLENEGRKHMIQEGFLLISASTLSTWVSFLNLSDDPMYLKPIPWLPQHVSSANGKLYSENQDWKKGMKKD